MKTGLKFLVLIVINQILIFTIKNYCLVNICMIVSKKMLHIKFIKNYLK